MKKKQSEEVKMEEMTECECVEYPPIAEMTEDMGRGDLNQLRDKINEIIKRIS